jgi:hypothetical protein
MKNPRPQPVLEAMIDSRVRQLQAQSPLVAASLVQIFKHCGRQGCHCQTGQKHVGHYLTFKVAGKTKTVYVPQDLVEEVGTWVQEHKRLRKLVQEISRLAVERIQGHVRTQKRKRGRP